MALGAPGETRCSVALRRGLESGVAEAVRAALDDLGAVPTLALVQVCAPGDAQAAGRALGHAGALIAEVAPECATIGSSAHGVIGAEDEGSVELRPAITVWMARLEGSRSRTFRLATVPAPHGGLAITGLPDVREDDGVALLLADPWTLPADEAVAAFSRVDDPLPVIGGLVSGGQRRGDSRLLLDGAVFDNGGVGIIVDRGAPVRIVVSQGCRPVGAAMTVTAADGMHVRELAGQPALQRLRDVVASLDDGDQALAVRGLHVGIARDSRIDGTHAADYVIRGILGVDGTTGAVTVGDDVPVGSVVRMHLRDADSADADLHDVISLARAATQPVGAFLVTCNGRGGSMFTSADHDAAVVREGLGVDAVGGFFAAGEIGPVGGSNHLHGFTAVILVVDGSAEARESPVEIARATESADAPADSDLDAELRELLEAP